VIFGQRASCILVKEMKRRVEEIQRKVAELEKDAEELRFLKSACDDMKKMRRKIVQTKYD